MQGKIQIPKDVNLDKYDLDKYHFDKGDTFPCDNCDPSGVKGRYKSEPFSGRLIYCNCQYGKKMHLKKQQSMESCFNHCGIPKRLHGVTVDTAKRKFDTSTIHSRTWDVFMELKRNFQCTDPRTQKLRDGITLLGKNGVGKSGLLVIMAREYWKSGLTPLYIKYQDLVKNGIQSGYDEYNKQEIQMSYIRKRIVCNADVLILDDLGDPFESRREQETKDRREILFNVIAERHERKLPILISGNYKSLDAIAKQFSPRIASRIKEMTAIATLHNRDLRE